MRRLLLVALLALGTAPLVGCFHYYKMDIQQGNVVTDKMLSRLELGMTQRQVHYVLGTPMVRDPFHASRWDYVYYLKKGDARTSEESRVTVFFENDKLARILKNGKPYTPSAAPGSSNTEAAAVKEDQEILDKPAEKKKGLFHRMWDKLGL
jgi:outer membrane protein assembly factor BamE